MSEAKAFVLLLIGVVAFVSMASVVVALTHASETVYALTITLGIALGGWTAGCIVVRYGKLRERREREEILLRR